MSETATQRVFQPLDEAHATQVIRVATSVYRVVVAAGAIVTLVAAVPAAAFLPSAEPEFWILAALAAVADVQPVRLPLAVRRSMTFVVSLCFCFAILLLYGT